MTRGGNQPMKVLKPGVTVDWSAELVCTGAGHGGTGCGAVLLVEKADLMRVAAPGISFDRTSWSMAFCCCACGALTGVVGVPVELAERLPITVMIDGPGPVFPKSMQCAGHEQTEARSWPPPLGAEGAEFGGGSVM